MGKKKKTPPVPAEQEFRNNPFAALEGLKAPPAATGSLAPRVPDVSERDDAAWGTKLVLRREKKGRGGKTVTCLAGVEASQREPLAKRMKKALGCGATIKGDEIVLLGSLVDRAADWLEAQGAPRVVRGN